MTVDQLIKILEEVPSFFAVVTPDVDGDEFRYIPALNVDIDFESKTVSLNPYPLEEDL